MGQVLRGCAALAALVGLSLGVAACSDDAGTNRNEGDGISVAGAGAGIGGLGGTAGSSAGAGGSIGLGASGAGAGGASGAGAGGAGGQGGGGGAGGAIAGAGAGGAGGSGGIGGAGGAAGAIAGTGGAAGPAMDMDGLRQACVDYINMYRATLGRTPLRRATPEQEACSDMGAKKDADSGDAHSSAGDCDGLGAQNTCPGYPVRGDGIAGIETSLKRCLDQMWDEGEPPVPIDQCIDDYQGCFLPHGHWINMQSTSSQVVSCGFYEMQDGSYWMNQDFGR
jgi:hypothetical protein